MRGFVGMAAMAVLVAGCSDSGGADADGDGSISVEEAVAEMADNSVRPQPGQYRSTTELLEVDLPGAPPEVVAMMRSTMSGTSTEYCLTQNEVENGFEEMMRQSQEGDCEFQRFNLDGGDFDAAMTCSVPQGGEMSMVMDGTGSRTGSDTKMTMTGNIPGLGESKMVMRVQAERIGDCAG